MLESLNHLYLSFNELTKNNPILAGAIGLWGLAVVTFAFRNIPLRIINFIVRQSTTTLTLNNSDSIYYDFLSWITKNKMTSLVRSINFNNSSQGGWGKASISIGYGSIPFLHKNRLMIMTRNKEEANQSSYTKESINITMLGRDKQVFIDLFEHIREKNEDSNYTKIYRWNSGNWVLLCRQYKRNLDTVILPEDTKKEITDHLDRFLNDKEWHIKNGIPWRTGIFLKGPPGTGKTSLIKALCAHYDKDMYVIDLSCLTDTSLREALSSVPEGGIVAMEDLDTYNFGVRIESLTKQKAETPVGSKIESPKVDTAIGMLTLGGLLNAIDGVASGEGRILIATTNHPENIDPAILRDGRFNVKTNIDYLNDETFRLYMKRMYPSFEGLENIRVNDRVAPCTLQRLVLENRDFPQKVLEKVAKSSQHIFADSDILSIDSVP